jgi:hypothetical protein
MKSHSPFLLAAAALALVGFAASHRSVGQSSGFDPELAALADQIQAQQKILAENQTKIEEQTEKVAEEVRVARIFASRVGKKTKLTP